MRWRVPFLEGLISQDNKIWIYDSHRLNSREIARLSHMKITTPLLIAGLFGVPFSHAQSPSMEERVKTLEEKVATLEALLLENSNNSAKQDPAQVNTAPVFYDGVQTWRGVRYLVQKDGFSIKDMDLPVIRFHAVLPTLNTSRQSSVEKIPRGLFQVGYITEKETVDHFHSLIKTPKPTKGWEEFEVDLSSAPKDKKIHLVFRYISTDARHHPNAGMQLDEITIFDDK